MSERLFLLRNLSLILIMRLLPFALYALLSRRLPRRHGAVVALALLALLAARWALHDLLNVAWLVLGMSYYLAISLLLPRLADALRAGVLTSGAAFTAIAFFTLILPGLVLPTVAEATFLIVGWELSMKAYSFVWETAHFDDSPSLAQRTLFLFVDPLLVFGQLGEPAPITRADLRAALAQLARGLFAMVAVALLLRPALHALESERGPMIFSAPWIVALFASEYLNRTGLAHIQSGLMRQAGWSVPERYDRPLLAQSPLEFWRRWNTYVRTWLEAYVFVPVARGPLRGAGPHALTAATVITLVASGLLHDLLHLAGSQAWNWKFVTIFSLCAASVVLWQMLAALLVWLSKRTRLAAVDARWLPPLRRVALFTMIFTVTGLWAS